MTVVRSLGSLASVDSRTSWSSAVVTASPGPGLWGLMSDYGAIWRTQPQVRKVVGFLARNIAQLNLTLYKRVNDNDRERMNDHPMSRVIAKPAGWQADAKLTKSLLFETLVSDRCIYDNAYWLKVRRAADDGVRLIPIPPPLVKPLGPDWLAPEEYQVWGEAGNRTFSAAEVVHFRGYNANDRRTGLSPIETLRQMLLEDLASDRSREQMWNRGARISGVIERPAGAPGWSDHAARRFREDWRAAWSGEGPEAGGTPVLEDGMVFKPATFSARDAQWLEAKKLTREEVAAAYFIPQPMIGILEHATFSNVTELHKQLYQDTLPPWLVGIEEDIDLQLLPEWPELVRDDCYVEFNIMEKLKGSFEEQARALQTFVGGPLMTRNEGRARLNLSSLPPEVGDVLITPLNVVVGGLASPTDTAPPLGQASAEDVTQVVTRFLTRCGRAVLGRWRQVREGKGSLASIWQAERWGRELVDDLEQVGAQGFEELALRILERTRAGVLTGLTAENPDAALEAFFASAHDTVGALVTEAIEEVTCDTSSKRLPQNS